MQAAERYEALLKQSQAALHASRPEIAEDTVWLRIPWGTDLSVAVLAALDSPEAIHADWLDAGLAADESNHKRILGALAGYARAEGHFPVGACGGTTLPPATRLSWIATMLPYFEHGDWHKELQFAYSWNGPQNKPVTQRPWRRSSIRWCPGASPRPVSRSVTMWASRVSVRMPEI